MIRILILSSILLFCGSAFAESRVSASELESISQSPIWKQLLVYQDGQSYVQSEQFFFAKDGATNPLSELHATLKAFAEPTVVENPDAHAQCKFAGRYSWLKTQLNMHALSIDEVVCPGFLQFTKNQQTESVSVVFATGFLGNPASYYGHLLIKLNALNQQINHNDLQDTAINFGADVPVDENMALYIIKGITGGYDSSFTQQQYFLHAGNYGESELRDLWEYELDLELDDVTLILGHIWELLDADYQYYFFNRNCAFHMGQLLQLVLQSELTQAQRLWVTPQAIMQNLASAQYRGRSVVKAIKYHPSRQSRLYQRFALLDNKQKDTVFQLVNAPEQLSSATLNEYDTVQQHQITDTLIDYYQFLRKADSGEEDENNRYYKQALLLRYRLPVGQPDTLFQSDSRPHLGRKPSLTSLQLTYNSVTDFYGKLQIRPAYYDALDAQQGHVKYSALSMGEVHFGFTAEKLFLRELSVIKIDSIRANLTGLPGDRNYSWYLDVGAIQAEVGCTDCTSMKLNSGLGYAFESSVDFNISGFIGAGYLGDKVNIDHAYIAAKAISTWYANEALSLNFDLEWRNFQTGRQQYLHKFALRYALAQDAEIRVSLSKDKTASEFGLSYGWYW